MGKVIEKTLLALGYVEPAKVKLTEVCRDIERRSGQKISKQRLAAILKAETLEPKTIENLAEGLGITVAELMSGNPRKKPR